MHGGQALGGTAERGAQGGLRLAHVEPPVERTGGPLLELGRLDGREPGAVEGELPADEQGEGVAVERLGAGDMPEAQELALGQLHAGRGHVGIVGRARALIHGGPEPLAGAAGADQLVHEVLLLALWTVNHARADDDGAAAGGHHRLLPFPLAAPVDGERPRRVGLGEGAAHAVEDVVARVEDKARSRRLCGARRSVHAVTVDGKGLVGVVLAVVHMGKPGRAKDPLGARLRDEAHDRGMIGEIEGREPRRGMGAVRAVSFVAARAQHGQQRGAYLSRGADDESAHDSRTIPNLGGQSNPGLYSPLVSPACVAIGLAMLVTLSSLPARAEVHTLEVTSPVTASLSGDLTVPTGTGPFPTVILLHGCAGIGPNIKQWSRW